MVKMLASSCVTTTIVAPQAVAQLEDQVVEQARADRIEPGRRLVEEQDVGIERHGARQAGALLHAAADLRRKEVLEALEADQRQLERGDLADLGRERSVNSPSGRPMFSASVIELNSAPLW